MSGPESWKNELRAINEDLAKLNVQLGEATEDEVKNEVEGRINTTKTAQNELKEKLLEHILSESSPQIIPQTESQTNTKAETSSIGPSTSTVDFVDRDSVNNSRRIKLKQPKEYKKGEDFATFGHRFQIFVESNRTDPTDYVNALLSCVDDITLQKLMPVLQCLTDDEKKNLKTLLDRCRETLYPQSEIRALRQQLTSAKIAQSGDEDVEAFAARIRSVVNRAGYTTEAEKSETCLNAFLNGLNGDLADKLYAAPDVENSFEIAVSTARKLEKMKSLRTSTAVPEVDNLASVFRVTQPQRGSRMQSQERSSEQQQLLADISEYSRRDGVSNHSPRRGNFNQRGRAAPRGRRERNEERTCYRCGVQGHIARFCRATAPLNM